MGGLSLRACVGLNWNGAGIEDQGGGRPTIKRALAGRVQCGGTRLARETTESLNNAPYDEAAN
jgi:hypothetical protein